jgi:membrane-associated protease RseP (regulator of RpoE activity)
VTRPDPEVRERRIAGGLFFATCGSVFVVHLFGWQGEAVLSDPSAVGRAFLFSTTLMAILLAHEMGHYATARAHGFGLSMPWFLPAPILVGTFGAIIRLRENPRTKTGLLEMGAMGPLAGLAVVVVVLLLRLSLGGPAPESAGGWTLSPPLLWWVVAWPIIGELPLISTNDPVAFAAWIGCLVTAMNLIPFGQLDGGHVFAAVFPKHAGWFAWLVTVALLAGGYFWPGWAVWAVLLHLLGTRTPVQVKREQQPLSVRALWLAVALILAFALCFTPVPIS